MEWRYVVALGSNRRHCRHGGPSKVLAAALRELGDAFRVSRIGPILSTAPLGDSRRRYANTAVLLHSRLLPDRLLGRLKAIERRFGRRPGGRRWGDRVLDLDLLLWEGGAWVSKDLVVPHVHFRSRAFALSPAARIAPNWRDPLTGLTLRQLDARLTRSQRLPIGHTRSGP